METINDVFLFLSKLDIVGYLEIDDYETFICFKKVLTEDFQGVNSEKLIYLSGVVDELSV